MGSKMSSSDSNPSNSLETSMDSEDMNIEMDNKEPECISVYVEPSLLKFPQTFQSNKKLFGIGGETFEDVEGSIVDKYSEFELFVHKMRVPNFFKMDDNSDKYCALPEDDSEEDDMEYTNTFKISIQKAPHGVIINNILYLTDHNWNTLVFMDPNTVNCMVCDQRMALLECPFHIAQKQHENNLDLYKPMPQFDFNIIRKIKKKYHCGICNEFFDINEDDGHLESKTHGENQLLAYNKASDVIFDSANNGNRNNDCYHFNANKINDNDTATNDWTVTDWGKESAYSDDYTDYTTNSESVDFDYEYDFTEYDDNELPLPGVSYASMAKKPKPFNHPKYLLVNTSNKKYKIPFDSWHMILINKNNTYWCMACKFQGYVSAKSKHCAEPEHVEVLRSFVNVKRFNNHIVREVNEKLYHCAHCNYLQLPHDMERHLNTKHPVKQGLYETTSTATNTIKPNDSAIPSNASNIIKGNDARNKNNDKHVNDTKIAVDNGNDEDFLKVFAYFTTNVTVYAFGPIINVLAMAYHVVCVKENCFYCGLCVVTLRPSDMLKHIQEPTHIRFLQLHQFLPQFGVHLVRYIHKAFHCAICNIPMNSNFIVAHTQSPLHMAELNKAFTPIPHNRNIQYLNRLEPRKRSSEAKPIFTKGDQSSNAKALTTEPEFKEPRKITKKNEVTTEETALTQKETGLVRLQTELRQQDTKLIKEETELMIDEDIEMDKMEDSYDSVDTLFDLESYVFVEFKGGFKLTATSYNTLVAIGNGSRHCFICNVDLEYEKLKNHVDSREHEKNLEEYTFLDKYGKNLIRQAYVLYHCCICNIILKYSELSGHFEWQPHMETLNKMKNIMKKERKSDVPLKMIAIKTQKENIFLDAKESEIKILYSAVIIDNKSIEKKKLFLVNDKLLKIKFESWHGIAAVKNGFKCIVCQMEFSKDISLHVVEEAHEKNLEKEFLKKYSPFLIREINSDIVNCLICNIEVSCKPEVITEHVEGRKHRKNYDIILKHSTEAETYGDCYGDVINI